MTKLSRTLVGSALMAAVFLAVAMVQAVPQDSGRAESGVRDICRSMSGADLSRWVGHPLPFKPVMNGTVDLTKGCWAVLIYDSDCDSCRDLVRDYEWLSDAWRDAGVGAVALIETADVSPERQLASGLAAAFLGRQERSSPWLGTTPAMIRIEDGVVVETKEGATNCRLEKCGLIR